MLDVWFDVVYFFCEQKTCVFLVSAASGIVLDSVTQKKQKKTKGDQIAKADSQFVVMLNAIYLPQSY